MKLCHRYLKVEHNYNYSRLFQQEMQFYHRVYYIPLSLNLSLLVSPDRYKVMFYTGLFGDIRLIDFTSSIDIPPPTFNISASNPVEIRRGGTQDIGIVLKSTALPSKVVSFTNLENHSAIQVATPGGKLNDNSAEPTSFNITVPDNIQVGDYTIGPKS
jgi:hypothetical protein